MCHLFKQKVDMLWPLSDMILITSFNFTIIFSIVHCLLSSNDILFSLPSASAFLPLIFPSTIISAFYHHLLLINVQCISEFL